MTLSQLMRGTAPIDLGSLSHENHSTDGNRLANFASLRGSPHRNERGNQMRDAQTLSISSLDSKVIGT